QNDYGSRGFQALGAVFNEEVNGADPKANLAVAGKFVNDFHVGFPVGRVPRDTTMSYLGLSVMGSRWGVPQIVMIDRKGQIVKQSDPKGEGTPEMQQEDSLRKYLDEVLGSAAPSKTGSDKKQPPAKDAKKAS